MFPRCDRRVPKRKCPCGLIWSCRFRQANSKGGESGKPYVHATSFAQQGVTKNSALKIAKRCPVSTTNCLHNIRLSQTSTDFPYRGSCLLNDVQLTLCGRTGNTESTFRTPPRQSWAAQRWRHRKNDAPRLLLPDALTRQQHRKHVLSVLNHELQVDNGNEEACPCTPKQSVCL